MGFFGKSETREEMHERENRERQETLEEYQDMFWSSYEVSETMRRLEDHQNIPYLKRLKNRLNQLAGKTPFLFGSLKEIPSHITDERDILIMRINNYLSENYDSEINFLEAEIEKLESKKNMAGNVTQLTSKYTKKDEPLSELVGLFGHFLKDKVGNDSENLISEYRRDIRELEKLVKPMLPAETAVDPQKAKIINNIEQIEKEIRANEGSIEQIKLLGIPEEDKRREENEIREEIGKLQLQLIKQKRDLAIL
jgi:hypothetical protein